MENNGLTCCFTGYRPQKLPFSVQKKNTAYTAFENRLITQIIDLVNEGCTTFISGMAAGFDIIAAECVTDVKQMINHTSLSLICAIPFAGQQNGYPPFWKEKYEDLLLSSDKTVVLSEKYYSGCYMKRNMFMVDNSDIVLTFWDGKPGGTKNTVDYALRKGRKVINLSFNGE